MDLDPVLLSRLQFAWVIGWHILLPAFTIGMASYITILEGMHLVTGRSVYLRISMYWIRIFSVAFGVGVVTGVIMPFQIGTNWSRYADTAGNVLGPLFAYEALTAFFLEAAFLGVLLFGRKLVPPWAHFVAALMITEIVSNGTLTLPSSLAAVGVVPGVAIIVFLGAFATYTAWALIRFKLRHPEGTPRLYRL